MSYPPTAYTETDLNETVQAYCAEREFDRAAEQIALHVRWEGLS